MRERLLLPWRELQGILESAFEFQRGMDKTGHQGHSPILSAFPESQTTVSSHPSAVGLAIPSPSMPPPLSLPCPIGLPFVGKVASGPFPGGLLASSKLCS